MADALRVNTSMSHRIAYGNNLGDEGKKIVGDAFVPLLMDSTLEGNGLADESEEFFKLGIDEDLYLTTLHIYYNDDLTVM